MAEEVHKETCNLWRFESGTSWRQDQSVTVTSIYL